MSAYGWRLRAALMVLLGAGLGIVLLALACGGGNGTGPKLVVNSILDVNERDGVLTLREALLLATGELTREELDDDERGQVDGSPGAEQSDTVTFDEATFVDDESATIALDSDLPAMNRSGDVVDGMGEVTVDGQEKGLTCFTMASDGNELKGLRVHGCQTAVLVRERAVGAVVGGPGRGNVLSGNMVGVEVRGEGTTIMGNLIGLDPAGAAPMPNEFEGIWVTSEARDTVIGGAGSGEGNVISGNELFGVSVDGAEGTVLQGNMIGLDRSGRTGIVNRWGITVQSGARETDIGDGTDDGRNIISSNNTGILVRGIDTEEVAVRGNYFGTDVDGEQVIANAVDILFLDGKGQAVVEDNFSPMPLNIREGGGLPPER